MKSCYRSYFGRLFDRISTQCPDVIELRQIALAFRAALKAGESGKLRQWIEAARRCEYGAVVRFAYGLKKDLSAVSAAVETSWSIEGYEAMHAIRKGQIRWVEKRDPVGQRKFIHTIFGVAG
jgi:hypothetical protein